MMDETGEEEEEEAWLQLRPVEPLPSQCCGSGCSPCVFDLYHRELARWEAARASKDRSLLSGEESQVREGCSSDKRARVAASAWPLPCTVDLCGDAFPDSAQQREKSMLTGSRQIQVQSLTLSWGMG